ncbi:M1 family metallopeptidase [Hellea balneolensis]|uniref:M1 family metallopeptidase n=1 Tax=Hellea balneolensis TaxID=287478 RepID=UPI0003F9A77C|nr:M1 family metallopeptidase [Hellea balneolensis]
MTFLRALALSTALSVSLAACQNEAATPDKSSAEVFRVDTIPHAQLPGNVVPQEYRVDMKMDPDAVGFSGVVEIDVEILKPTDKIWLHGKTMTVRSATAMIGDEQMPLVFTELPAADAPSGIAHLTSETVLPAGKATFRMAYETPYNQALNSAYQVKRGGEGYIVTQFEPLGAREAFPSFDEPKYKVPFTLSITAPESDFVYSNTPEVSNETTEEGWIKHQFAKTRPLPTYLIAFGAGPYDVNDFGDIPPNSIRKTPLAQRGFTAKGQGDEISYGLAGTEPILTALEEYFGTPYPYEKLDIIAAPEYAFGAMENPGAIVYREYLMLLNEDSPLSQKRAYNRVHSHELAHQWFGNLVTPVWWEDIWLNEAFATWMGNKAIDIAYPDANYDRVTLNASLGAMNIDTLSTTRRVREPLLRSENVMDQFDGITYRKGGGTLDMFESYVGEEKFRDGVRLHMERYKDGVATGDNFFQSIADGSGNPDVVDAMKSFVDQPGVPLVKVEVDCQDGDMNTLVKVSQSRYVPLGSKTKQGQTWQIPVCASTRQGEATAKTCSLVKKTSETIEVPNRDKTCAPYIVPNENGSGYYRFTMDTQAWHNLISNLDKLNTREALSAQDSLVSAFRAGEVDSAVFLKGLEAFAKHPEYDVASGAGALLGFMDSELDAEDDVARLVRDMFAERYAANVGKDTVEGNLLVPTLASRLVYLGQDKKLTAEMAAKGAAYLGLKGKANKKAVAPNLAGLALAQAMKAHSEKAYAPLLEMASNGSAFEKGAALGALSSTNDKTIAANLRDLALAEDSPLTGRQANSLVGGLIRSDMHGEDTWEWLKDNFATFVERKVPDVRLGGMPGFARGCSLERRDEAKAFFESQADIIPGYERSLAQTLERIELCAALKEAKADELTAALKAR